VNLIEKALQLAIYAHEGQIDLAGDPYILHPLWVASHFVDHPFRYAGAVCHDVVEDTFKCPRQVTIKHVYEQLDLHVALIVNNLTRRKVGMLYIDKLQGAEGGPEFVEATKDESYDDYIQRLSHSRHATLIKLKDLAHNLSVDRLTRIPLNPERLKRYWKAHRQLSLKVNKYGES
jgi:(p)ppGpp synthase/HD superfamily hydrolase